MKKRLTAVLLVLAMLLTCVPALAVPAGREAGEQTDDEILTCELVDLGEIEPVGTGQIMPVSAADGQVDLATGLHEEWIDRIVLPENMKSLYSSLVTGSDPDSETPYLINDEYFDLSSANEGWDTANVGDFVNGKCTFAGDTSDYDVTFTGFLISKEENPAEKQPNYTNSCAFAVMNAFDRDHPEVFWLDGSSKLFSISSILGNVKTKYTFFLLKYYSTEAGDADNSFDIRREEFQEQSKITEGIRGRDSSVETIMNSMPSGSTFDKVKYFNTWLAAHNQYNTHDNLKDPTCPWDMRECVNALAGKTGLNGPVCESYARALKVLCDKAEIPCVLVDGNARSDSLSGGESHMWNYVQMEDSKWYAVDVTWDDPVPKGDTPGQAESSYETDKWLLLGANSLVNDNWTFIESHPVSNTVSQNGVAFTNGPELNQTAYATLSYSAVPEGLTAGAQVDLTAERNPIRKTDASMKFTFSAAGLPEGLSIDSSTGGISGTLAQVSSENRTATVTLQENGNEAASCEIVFPGIPKKKNSVTFTDPADTFYKDGDKDPEIKFEAAADSGGPVTFTYRKDGESDFTSNVPTEIGSYTVRATADETEEYESAYADHNFSIVAKEIVSISLEGPAQKSYIVGQKLNLEGLTVTATYNDSTTRQLSEDEYSVSEVSLDHAGTFEVKVTAGSVSATFTVTVSEKKITGLSVSPQALEYEAYDTFDASKVTVTATYDDASTAVITDYTVTYPDSSRQHFLVSDSGEKVTLSAGDASAAVQVTVSKKKITLSQTEWSLSETVYTGSEQTVTVECSADSLPEGVALSVSYGSGCTATYAGSYTANADVTTNDEGNCEVQSGNLTHEWTIAAAEQSPAISFPEKVTVGASVDLKALVTGAKGDVTLALSDTGSTGSTLDSGVFQAGTTPGTVTVHVSAAEKDENDDGTPEYREYSSDKTIEVVPKQKITLTVTQSGITYGETLPDPKYEKVDGATAPAVTYSGTLHDGTAYSSTAQKPSQAGTYKVEVAYETAEASYSGSAEFEIKPRDIGDAEITVTTGTLTYNEQPQTVAFTVKAGGTELVRDTDYTVSGGSDTAVDAGTHTLTVAGKGNYTGTASASWEIQKAVLDVSGWTWDYDGPWTYDGSSHSTVLTGVPSEKVQVTYTGNTGTDAGTYSAKAEFALKPEFAGNWQLSAESSLLTWTISKAAAQSIAAAAEVRYSDTSEQTVTLESMLAGADQKFGTVSVQNASSDSQLLAAVTHDAGSVKFALKPGLTYEEDAAAVITVSFDSTNYETSTVTLTVRLVDRKNADSQITFDPGSKVYSGKEQTCAPAVFTGTAGPNPKWTYTYLAEGARESTAAAKNAGTYTVTAVYEDDLNYGSATGTFIIEKAPLTVSSASIREKEYDGTKTAEAESLTFSGLQAGETLVKDTDYTVTAEFTDAHRGDGKDAVWNAALLDTVKARNYRLASASGTAAGTIRPKDIGEITAVLTGAEGLTYTGKPHTPAVAASYGAGEVLDAEDYVTAYADNTDAGTATVTVSPAENGNYAFAEKQLTFTIDKAAHGGETAEVSVKAGSTERQTVDLAKWIVPGGTAGTPAVEDTAGITAADPVPAAEGARLTFTLSGAGRTGDTAVIRVPVTSKNYQDYTITVTVTLIDREAQSPLTITSADKVTYGLTLELAASGGSGTGTVTYRVASGPDGGRASIEGNVLKALQAGTVSVTAEKAGDENYLPCVSEAVTVTIEKAVPQGTPTCEAVTRSGRKLADVPLSGTFVWAGQEVDGTLAWADSGETEVRANTGYGWTFTPRDTVNFSQTSGTLTPWRAGSSGNSSGGNSGSSSETAKPPVNTSDRTENGQTTTQTSTQPKADVHSGSASASVSSSTGDELVRQAEKNGSSEVVIAPSIRGDVKSTEVAIPRKTVKDLAERTEASMTVDTPAASVTLPGSSMEELGSEHGKLVVRTGQTDAGTEVELLLDGKKVDSVAGGVKLEMPCNEIGSGTVAVLVHEDGTTEVIRTSVADPEEGTVRAQVDGSAVLVIRDNSRSFDDVDSGDWFSDSVAFASSHELMNGIGNDKFDPAAETSRGSIAMILYHLEHDPEAGDAVFQDTDSSAWYTDAVTWAASSGIVNGYGNGSFGPDDVITREQMAVILYHYAQYRGLNPETDSSREPFPDADRISSWAEDAMSWAAAEGLIAGDENGNARPGGTASRAEAAAVLMRFCRYLAE